MDKRNKAWRRKQFARVFKARMVFHATDFGVREFVIIDNKKVYHPHWFELAKSERARAYKTTVQLIGSFKSVITHKLLAHLLYFAILFSQSHINGYISLNSKYSFKTFS